MERRQVPFMRIEARAGASPARVLRPCMRAVSLLLLCALSLLAACRSAEPLGRIVTPSKVLPSDPPLNPHPRHVVRLHGRAPETLDFRFRIAFLSTNREGDCWNHAGFWEGGGERGWGYDLYPVRTGERWEADLVVDRYLPGRCGWNIRGSAVIMVEPTDAEEGEPLGAGTRLVVADTRTSSEDEPRCRREDPWHAKCDEARSRRLSNADDAIAVQVRCLRLPPEERIGDTVFACDEFPEHKMVHRLKSHTRSIRIDLYDLNRENAPETTPATAEQGGSHD